MPRNYNTRIVAPYRHDLGRKENLRRLGGSGTAGLANVTRLETIAKQVLAELMTGKGCAYCAKERQGEGEEE